VSAPAPARRASIALLYASLAVVGAGSILLENLVKLPPGWAALASFSGVIAAALLISWGAEAAQFQVSRGFAIAFIAFLQVLPEFMVEATLAWKQDIPLMFANATGSNRILIGLGWTLIFFTTDVSSRLQGRGPITHVALERSNIVEVLALGLSSSYYLVLIAKRTLAVYDTVILGGIFVAYLLILRRLPTQGEEEKEELLAPPRAIVELPTKRARTLAIGAIFLLGGLVMGFVADPFIESMRAVAVGLGVSSFTFVQWVAPLLSEFPEKVTAFYWSKTVRLAPMALLNMIASTINQYTALVAMIPAVYALSRGHAAAVVPMDAHHRAEIFLSFAMTLYGCACLLKFRYTRANAIVMFVLWLLQFASTKPMPWRLPLVGTDAHLAISVVFIALALGEVAVHWRELDLHGALTHARDLMRRGTPTSPPGQARGGT
jgi:cation:H+ antiporter